MLQPSNFLLMRDNPLTAVPSTPEALECVADFRSGAATGAYMSASSQDEPAESMANNSAAAESDASYMGGWLKGVDFGCSNEAPPGLLLCKMTVRHSD